jgi:hypothetical protein
VGGETVNTSIGSTKAGIVSTPFARFIVAVQSLAGAALFGLADVSVLAGGGRQEIHFGNK